MSLQRNIVANYIGQGWTVLMGLAFVPIYVHQLGMEAYGLIGFYALLQAGLVLFDMGVSQTLNREMARYTAGQHTKRAIHIFLRSVEIVGSCAALLVGGIIWLGSHWMATHWVRANAIATTEVAQAIAIMALIIALRLMEGLYRGGISGLQQQVMLNVTGAALATARWGGAACIVLWVNPTITAFFTWQALVSVAATVIYRYILFQSFPTTDKKPRFSAIALKEVKRFSGGMLATAALALLLTQSDKLLLSRILSLEAFGYYTLATLVSNALYQVIGPITQALFPRLTELVAHENSEELVANYHLGAQLMTVFLMPPALLLMVFGRNLLNIWTGDTFISEQVAPVLTLLALGTMLNGLMGMPHMLQLAHGWAGFAVRSNTIAVAILVPLIIWVTPHYGTIGAAWAWVTLNAGYVLIGIHFMHQRLLPKEKWYWYWRDLITPAAPVVILMLISQNTKPDNLGRLAELCWIFSTTLFSLIAAALCAPSIRQGMKKKWSLSSWR